MQVRAPIGPVSRPRGTPTMRLRALLIVPLVVLNFLSPSAYVLAQTPSLFDPPVVLPAGTSPTGIQLGDLNRDQHLDLVVSNRGSGAGEGAVSIFLSNGDGSFEARRDYRSDGQADGGSPAIVDFTGDGHSDVLVANGLSNSVSILQALRTGRVGRRIDLDAGELAYEVAAADLNMDGLTDFGVTNYRSNSVSIFISEGHGRFASRVDYPGHNGSGAIGFVDLNLDGILDLVVGNLNNDSGIHASTVSVRLGAPGGIFGPAMEFQVGRYAGVVLVGDFDENGNPDLASVNGESRTVSVLIGDGAGGFATSVDYATGDLPLGGAVGDLNGDGHVDLVVTNHQEGTISVLHGRGDGTFADRQDHFAGGQLHDPTGIAAGDLNGDDRVDLVIANSSSNTVAILLNRGAGAANVSAAQSRTLHESSARLLVERNPIRGGQGTDFRYRVPDGGAGVSIEIFSVTGRKILDLSRGYQAGGLRAVHWDGLARGGRPLPAGVYFVRAVIGKFISIDRVVLID